MARIAAARTLVAGPLLVTLEHNLRAKGCAETADWVRNSINPEWSRVGEIVLSDAVLHPYTLHLRMSRVPRNYRLEIAIPQGYEKALAKYFALFRAAAQSFWKEWLATASESAGAIAGASLHETETAMYVFDDDQYWVGIFGYFVDGRGRKYMMK